MFDKLTWEESKMTLNGLNFILEQAKEKEIDSSEGFIFYKLKTLIDQYEAYFKQNIRDFKAKNIIELGMWDGGSIAFWNEILHPDKIVGIDLLEKEGGGYFNKYLDKINTTANKKVVPYWGTNQMDALKLRKIINENFGNEPIDLVFDDASHMYEPSLASFNTIFPFLAKGGLYIIEDWAWGHWKGFETMYPPNVEPTKLIFELVQASGNVGLIENLVIYQGFVVVIRGSESIKDKENFKLQNHVYNRNNTHKYFGYLKGSSIKQKTKAILEILRN